MRDRDVLHFLSPDAPIEARFRALTLTVDRQAIGRQGLLRALGATLGCPKEEAGDEAGLFACVEDLSWFDQYWTLTLDLRAIRLLDADSAVFFRAFVARARARTAKPLLRILLSDALAPVFHCDPASCA